MATRRGWRFLSRFTLLAMLLALLPIAPSNPGAARQDLPGVNVTRYESPTYGFTLEWNDSWQATRATSANGVDSLSLANGVSTVAIAAYPFAGDSASCIQARVGQLQIDPDIQGLAPVPDQNGEPLMGTDEVGSYAIYQFSQADANGTATPMSVYLDCRAIPDSGAVLLIEHTAPLSAYNDELAARSDLLASLSFAGDQPSTDATPAGAVESGETSADEGAGPSIRWSMPGSRFDPSTTQGRPLNTYVAFDAQAMYVSERFGTTVALDWESGTRLWATSPSTDLWSLNEITAANGMVAVVLQDAIVGLDGATGEERWRRQLCTDGTNCGDLSPLTVLDGTVFVHDYQNDTSTVYGIDIESGEEQWRADVGPLELYQLPAANGTVYAANTQGTLYALDATTGEERWTFAQDWGSGWPPVVAGDTVLTTDSAGTLYAIDTATGEENWRRAANVKSASFWPPIPANVVANDQAILGLVAGEYVAWETESGDELWRVQTDSFSMDSVAIADDLVYIQNAGIQALDIATGEVRWNSDVGGLRPVLHDGALIVTSGEFLIAIDAVTGHELWRAPVGGATAAAPLIHDGAVVLQSNGLLQVIDPGSVPESARAPSQQAPPVREQLIVATQGILDSVPQGEAVVGLWRLTIAPGSQVTFPQFAGPVSLYVESGTVSTNSPLNLIIYEGSTTEPDSGSLMQSGESFFLAAYERVSGTNTGPSDAIVLVSGILPGAQPVLPESQTGIAVEPLGVGAIDVVPDTGMTVELVRETIPPGATLPLELMLWPRVLAVETGAVEIRVLRGAIEIQGGTPRSITTGQSATIAANESAFIPPGTVFGITNANQGPLSMLVVDGWGNTSFVGGMAGCGGRCLTVTTP